MHHHNCHLLAAIARELSPILQGQTLVKCFSNTVDEIYFEFDAFSFRCIFYKGELHFSFDNTLIGESRLFKPQFREIQGLPLTAVVQHPYERSFHFVFGRYQLVFKCHGRKSNILLMQEGETIDIFRRGIDSDLQLTLPQLAREIKPEFDRKACSSPEQFKTHYPYLSEDIFYSLPQPNSSNDFEQLLNTYNKADTLRFSSADLALHLSYTGRSNMLEAVTAYTAALLKHQTFTDRKHELSTQLALNLKEKEAYLQSNRKALEQLINHRKDEELGNILLANIHAIPEGSKGATLDDLYGEGKVYIKLNDKLSVVKNAEAYFKKDKARPHTIEQLQKKIDKASAVITTLKQQLEIVTLATSLKDLRTLDKSKDKTQGKEEQLPYKRFVYNNYEILAGKHAESNEQLLNYFSDKEDIWLHAKDVGGSHVIIKTGRKKDIPQPVLEVAASIAAYYSKSRQQQLATVTWTLRKYVRKIKGAEKGKVTVSHEQTLLVPPGLPV